MATAKKRKEKKSVYEGNVYIQATFNNTIVTITVWMPDGIRVILSSSRNT